MTNVVCCQSGSVKKNTNILPQSVLSAVSSFPPQKLRLSGLSEENVLHGHAEPQRAVDDSERTRRKLLLSTFTSEADREDCGSHGSCHRPLCSSAAAAVAVMHLIGRAGDLSPTILP